MKIIEETGLDPELVKKETQAAISQNEESKVEKRCYTVEELQCILAVSRPTVYALIKKKEFSAFQIGGGGKWRISKQSFDTWLESHLI